MLLRLALRGVLAWGVLTLLVGLYGPRVVVAASPVLQATVESLLPGFVAKISLAAPVPNGAPAGPRPGDVTLELQAMQPVQIAGSLGVTPWVKIPHRITAGHDLVAAVVFFTVLLAWPFRAARQCAAALALGLPVCALLVLWLVSVHFVGLFEIALQDMARLHGLARAEPWLLGHFIFNESGGQWMLALLAATAVARFGSGMTKK